MDFFAIWVVMGLVVAIIASSKGKSGLGWFVYGLLIWPIALVHILVTSRDQRTEDRRALSSGGKKCPECAEIVKQDALVCRFCGNRSFGTGANYSIDQYGRTVIHGREYTPWEKLWWKPKE